MTTVNEVVFFYVISKQTHTGKQLQPVRAFVKKENFILKINQKHSILKTLKIFAKNLCKPCKQFTI